MRPVCRFLLVAYAPVSCEHQVEARFFGPVQQGSVAERVSADGLRGVSVCPRNARISPIGVPWRTNYAFRGNTPAPTVGQTSPEVARLYGRVAGDVPGARSLGGSESQPK